MLKIEIEIAIKIKENRPASIPTFELKHLKLSHMDLYSDSINKGEKYCFALPITLFYTCCFI